MAERNFGRSVLTSSMAQFGHQNQPAYAAAKTGIIGLTKSLAHEAQETGLDIRVNAICDVREHLDEILNTDGYFTPVSANDQTAIVERLVLGRAV
jgi:NAD(P)-dependent dehydrogenase (short-subunit alcohol dehydrogenase family)